MSRDVELGRGLWGTLTCTACPLQLDGTVEGAWWYFRARSGLWELGMSRVSFDDAVEATIGGPHPLYGPHPEPGPIPGRRVCVRGDDPGETLSFDATDDDGNPFPWVREFVAAAILNAAGQLAGRGEGAPA